MDINELQHNWNQFGEIDPLWSILVRPDKEGNKWQVDEFFKTGIEEADAIITHVESLGFNIPRRKALDFGSGVGRLTQALANYFDEAHGVDIAPSMIELAGKFNSHGDRCRYYLNETDDLKLFADNTFDFIYTNITLQHIAPRYSRNYIKEFVRVLIPHGLLIFHQPSEPILEARDDKPGAKSPNQPKMEMYGIKRQEVVAFLEANGAKVVEVVQDQTPPAPQDWVSFRYCVTKE
jgi:ubiquinone/menaquinone biosynthesis C-methylase UbiE